jgi:hypothetical protein
MTLTMLPADLMAVSGEGQQSGRRTDAIEHARFHRRGWIGSAIGNVNAF